MSTADVAVSFPAVDKNLPEDGGAFWRLVRRYTPKQGWDAFLLMLGAVILVGFTLLEASWVETPGLLAIILWASVAGLGLSKVRLPWPLLHVVGSAFGFVVVAWQSSTLVDGATMIDRNREVWDRLEFWYDAAASGGISTDLLPFTIALLTLAWFLGYLSAWFLFRNSNVWIGLVLGGLAMLTNLSYLPDGYDSRFFAFLLLAMLLVARITLLQRQDTWRGANFRFVSSRWLSLQAAVAISVVVLALASFLPMRVFVWQSAVDVWNFGRAPIASMENEFARLFSGIASQKDVFGRFFGDTLPFQGNVSFGGEVVMQAKSEYPAYWLDRTYSEYAFQGWLAGETNEIRVGPASLPPPPQESFNRVPVIQDVVVGFDTNNLWIGGNLDWISREVVAMTLAPPKYRLDMSDSSRDGELPDDVRAVAGELRKMLNPLSTVFAEAEIARVLPTDLNLVDVSPSVEDTNRDKIDNVTIARKEPTIPDIVGWKAVDRLKADEAYGMRSYISLASIEDLRETPAEYSGFIRGHYLQLPESLPQRVRDLAAQVTAEAGTPVDKALELQDYLRSGAFEYSQDVEKPPRGADGVDYFLFETKTGYSDYYASAMAVMLRAVGVPARLAAGYAPGQDQEGTDYRQVRDSDSHGWTQAYFPGHGWIDFEPTPAWPLQPRGEPDEAAQAAAVAEPDTGDLAELDQDPCFGVLAEDEIFTVDDEDCIGGGGANPRDTDVAMGAGVQGLAGLAVAIAAAAAVISLLMWAIWARGFASSSSPENMYSKMGRLGTLAGMGRRCHQTPIEYADSLGKRVPSVVASAQTVARIFAAERYGRKEPSEEELIELRETWKGVRGRLVGRAFRRLILLGASSQA